MSFPNSLVDKSGNSINNDDVLFDGENHWRIYCTNNGTVEMVGRGYIHNVTQNELSQFIRIGSFSENSHLMVID